MLGGGGLQQNIFVSSPLLVLKQQLGLEAGAEAIFFTVLTLIYPYDFNAAGMFRLRVDPEHLGLMA